MSIAKNGWRSTVCVVYYISAGIKSLQDVNVRTVVAHINIEDQNQ